MPGACSGARGGARGARGGARAAARAAAGPAGRDVGRGGAAEGSGRGGGFTAEEERRYAALLRRGRGAGEARGTESLPSFVAFARLGLEDSHLRQVMKSGLLALPPAEVRERCLRLRAMLPSDAAFFRAVKQCPQLLRLSQGNLEAKRAHLLALGLQEEEVDRIVEKRPEVLFTSVEAYDELVDFLQDALGLDLGQVCLALRREPSLLWRSTERMLANLDFLYERGLSKEQAQGAVLSFPSILRYSVEGMDDKFAVLEAHGLSPQAACDAVAKHPFLLSLAEDTLDEKLSFFVNDLGWAVEDVVKMRKCLTYSLSDRLRPRTAFAKHLGVRLRSKTYWMDITDKNFAKSLRVEPEVYEAFLRVHRAAAKGPAGGGALGSSMARAVDAPSP